MLHLRNVAAKIVGIILLTTPAALAEGEEEEVDAVVHELTRVHVLTDGDFDERVQGGKNGPWFVEFYAPWCGHCQKLTPEWDALPAILGSAVQVAKVDATTETRVAGEFEIQGFPTLKMFANGKMYPYEGARTTDAMALWASGGYTSGTSEKLPSEKTWVDAVQKSITALGASIMKVHNFLPALLPAVLGVGILMGLFVASCCGLCGKAKVSRDISHTFDTKVSRDDAGSLGMEIAPMTMTIKKKDDRAALSDIDVGDTILAVNKCHVIDSDDYRRLAHGVKEFTLTMGRSSKPSNGNHKKEQ